MKRLLLLLSLLCSIPVHAQLWAPILPSGRATDWTGAGVTGGIPTRSTICSTLNPGATGAQINAAIAACPANQVVFLNSGTYTISGGIIFNGKSNVTLRGNGPKNTILNFTSGNVCGGQGGNICVIPSTPIYTGSAAVLPPAGLQQTTWTAGFSQGTTQITVTSSSGINVGSVIILDQKNDTSDNGGYTVCDIINTCHQSGESGSLGRSIGGVTYAQMEVKTVTNVVGNVITISPAIQGPNWRIGQTPAVFWGTTKVSGVGLENFTINNLGSGTSVTAGIFFYSTTESWVRGVKSTKANRNHIWLYQSNKNSIFGNYFFGTQNSASQSYGVEEFFSSDNLIENNIFDTVTAAMMAGSSSGSVHGYNYATKGAFGAAPSFMAVAGFALHDAGPHMNLWEGNSMNGIFADDIHGSSGLNTYMRNRLTGREGSTTTNTVPITMQSLSRGNNIIANVLGIVGYHTVYEKYPSGPAGSCELTIFQFGFPFPSCTGSAPPQDPLVRTSSMRWGNWDAVNQAFRYQSSEVPTSGLLYIAAASVPVDHTIPNSFYLSGKPSWYGNVSWPVCGEDVTGGDVTGVDGHCWKTPAQLCFENSASTGGILDYDYDECLAAISGGGGTPLVSVSPASLTFGVTSVESPLATQAISLTNIGTGALTISSIAITGTDYTQTNNCGGSLAASATCTITVTFRPKTVGVRTATLSITSDAATSPDQLGLTSGIVTPVVSITGGKPS